MENDLSLIEARRVPSYYNSDGIDKYLAELIKLDCIYVCGWVDVKNSTIPIFRLRLKGDVTQSIQSASGRNLFEIRRPFPVVFQGQHFPSLAAFCKEKNLKYNAVYNRLKDGMTLEKALQEIQRVKPLTAKVLPTKFIPNSVFQLGYND